MRDTLPLQCGNEPLYIVGQHFQRESALRVYTLRGGYHFSAQSFCFRDFLRPHRVMRRVEQHHSIHAATSSTPRAVTRCEISGNGFASPSPMVIAAINARTAP